MMDANKYPNLIKLLVNGGLHEDPTVFEYALNQLLKIADENSKIIKLEGTKFYQLFKMPISQWMPVYKVFSKFSNERISVRRDFLRKEFVVSIYIVPEHCEY
jgi:hypothetical protein